MPGPCCRGKWPFILFHLHQCADPHLHHTGRTASSAVLISFPVKVSAGFVSRTRHPRDFPMFLNSWHNLTHAFVRDHKSQFMANCMDCLWGGIPGLPMAPTPHDDRIPETLIYFFIPESLQYINHTAIHRPIAHDDVIRLAF